MIEDEIIDKLSEKRAALNKVVTILVESKRRYQDLGIINKCIVDTLNGADILTVNSLGDIGYGRKF